MSAETQPVRTPDVERALEALRRTKARAPLAALAFDVLSRQAEGRTFFSGAKFVKARAEEHGVTREQAQTESGDLFAILERGAKEPLERALVAAFAVAGLASALEDAEDAEKKTWRFVRHADWLEVSTDYAIHPFIDTVLDSGAAAQVWKEIAQAVVDDAAGRDGERPEVRAKNAARLTSLAASSSTAARDALREVIRSAALDEPTRLLASTLAGDGAEEGARVSPRLEGLLGRAPRSGAIELLRWVSGWALLSWLLRGIAFVLGVRRRAELRLSGGALEVKTRVTLLGRVVREGEETWRIDALEGAGRRVRYPTLHLLVGAIGLSFGVLFGGLVLFDGVRSGELVLVMIACGLLLGGAALDLALDVLWPGSKGRVVVDVSTRTRRPLRLTRVPLEQADAFLRALEAGARGRRGARP